MPLDVPLDPAAAPAARPRLVVLPAAALAGVLALAWLAERSGWVGGRVARSVGVPAAHGALLTAALGAADRRWRWHAGLLLALLAAAAAATAWSAWGACLYLTVPLALTAIARREPALAGVGLCAPPDGLTVLLGAGVGLALGGHLLLSASRTFGYEIRAVPLEHYLVAIAYDLGANVPSAESFFRGVVFNRAQRRWPFLPAAALATAAALLRYLVDPALPRAVETVVAAVFYLSVLSVAGCALFWRSGSVLPGALAAMGFFACYRAVRGWW